MTLLLIINSLVSGYLLNAAIARRVLSLALRSSTSILLHPLMDSINNLRDDPRQTVVNERTELIHGLFLRQVEREALTHLLHHFVGLDLDVRDVGVGHEREQVEDQAAGLAQRRVGRVAVLLEGGEVGRFGPAHPFHHGQRDLDRRRCRFRVSAEDVAEVDVEEVSCLQCESTMDQRWERLYEPSGVRRRLSK